MSYLDQLYENLLNKINRLFECTVISKYMYMYLKVMVPILHSRIWTQRT